MEGTHVLGGAERGAPQEPNAVAVVDFKVRHHASDFRDAARHCKDMRRHGAADPFDFRPERCCGDGDGVAQVLVGLKRDDAPMEGVLFLREGKTVAAPLCQEDLRRPHSAHDGYWVREEGPDRGGVGYRWSSLLSRRTSGGCHCSLCRGKRGIRLIL
jgi:hypothetical protein